MPLVTSEKMLLDAKKDGYAVGAFNVENMELETFAGIVKAEAAKTKIPVCLHLDHGNSFELAVQAMKAGYTSVMIDGSHEDFENNIAVTKKVVDVANAFGIPVEAELGKVGGKEDDLEADADTNTDPQEAKEFVERTGVSSLAVAIGTAHGFYVGTPVLDKQRVSAIKEVVDVPLVLHGASGLSEEDVRECVERGMCKVNFATELRVAYTDAVKKLLEEKPETFDPKKLGVVAMEAVKEQVVAVLTSRMFPQTISLGDAADADVVPQGLRIARMKMCGCDGKAK